MPAKLLSARYMTRFRCLAADCEATCCGGGAVPVEQSTHRRLTLLAEPDAAARELLEQGIELTPQGPDFARLRFRPSGDCSMLDGAGLCRIHARFGHAALFEVCATYPCYASEVDGQAELFGSLSCPEISRLALLAEDGFEPVVVELAEVPRKLRNSFTTERPYFRPYRQVRAALERLLQEPRFSLSERLFVLLWIADQLRPILHAGCGEVPPHDLQAVLAALAGVEVLERLAAAYRGLELDGTLLIAVIWHALPPAPQPRAGAQTERFDLLVAEVWATYGRVSGDAAAAASDERLAELWAHYAAVRAVVPGKVRERLDACLSRFALNYLVTTPYMLKQSLFAYAYELVVRVSMLRFLLETKLSNFEGTARELDAEIVQATYAFVRGVEHGNVGSEVQRLLDGQGLSGLPHALCFLAH